MNSLLIVLHFVVQPSSYWPIVKNAVSQHSKKLLAEESNIFLALSDYYTYLSMYMDYSTLFSFILLVHIALNCFQLLCLFMRMLLCPYV